MLRLMEPLSASYSPRTYVVADTDVHSTTKVEDFERGKGKHDYTIAKFPCVRASASLLRVSTSVPRARSSTRPCQRRPACR